MKIRPMLKSFRVFNKRVGQLENKTNIEITFMYFTNG